ncbi:dTDP-4-dehydrorhamnose 3,5-epimerase [Desulfonatronovibrio hydrogenovorans]|uniref:dTDP-4-dehydrorhamnose 3,5-epimerase n=1 Tax=Desulfonatronovibrio hydrogenovorans TaxID=53245 RepID=UPI00049050D4|nr:dTDP-4-dehydrorhamnose 3,5-epimerase [Desulfonatronovibrio hydrogenovorans]
MKLSPTSFPGLFVVLPKVFQDHRGFFMEFYSKKTYADQGLDLDFVQDNHALSSSKGVLRGLHFQVPPMDQAKLVRVTRGAVQDVVVDLRSDSPTYGKWFSIELSASNFKQLLIPRGFAHGYLTLEENTEFQYKVDAFYDPECERGIRYDDPGLKINWLEKTPILSDKDRNLPGLNEFESPFRL